MAEEAKIDWSFASADKTETTVVNEDGTTIFFHPTTSTGTAVIKGKTSLLPDYHHYWELEMQAEVFGTDVMVGIGTEKAAYDQHKTIYASVIGIDSESWGFSYQGRLHHNQGNLASKPKNYSIKNWNQGSIVGIYYNGWNRTIEFYLNRTPLGVAFSNIPKEKQLFPMMSSTAAKVKMKLICAQKFPSSLAFECARVLCKPKPETFTEPYLTYAVPLLLYAKNNKCNLLMNTSETLQWTKRLPPGLGRFIDENCWFLIGCKLKDLKPLRSSISKADEDGGGFHMMVLSSDEEEDIVKPHPTKKQPSRSTRGSKRLRKRKEKVVAATITDDDEDDEDDEEFGFDSTSVGPGPSVQHVRNGAAAAGEVVVTAATASGGVTTAASESSDEDDMFTMKASSSAPKETKTFNKPRCVLRLKPKEKSSTILIPERMGRYSLRSLKNSYLRK